MENPDHSQLITQSTEILKNTNDGNLLEPSHLALVQLAVNNMLSQEGINAFTELYTDVVINRDYQQPFAYGVEHITRDHDGYVYYKGHQVEHFSFHNMTQEDAVSSLTNLSEHCQRMEYLGLNPSVSNYMSMDLLTLVDSPYHPLVFMIEHSSSVYHKDNSWVLVLSQKLISAPLLSEYTYLEIHLDTQHYEQKTCRSKDAFYHVMKGKGFEWYNFREADKEPSQALIDWFSKAQLKLWHLNPPAFPEFALSSVHAGHIIEIPESLYNEYYADEHWAGWHHSEDGDDRLWSPLGEPIDREGDHDSDAYLAVAKKDDRFYARLIPAFSFD